jgi:hemoglobin-like flavoprotein
MTTYDAVRASYDRCYASGDFSAVFYRHFFAQAPEIALHFAKTDFVEQKRHLRASLLTLIKYTPDEPVTTNLLQKLGHKHSRNQLNIRPRLYPYFVNALMRSLRECDPEWSEELEDAWRKRIAPGIAYMISFYDSTAA